MDLDEIRKALSESAKVKMMMADTMASVLVKSRKRFRRQFAMAARLSFAVTAAQPPIASIWPPSLWCVSPETITARPCRRLRSPPTARFSPPAPTILVSTKFRSPN